jgi:hypothetical protein
LLSPACHCKAVLRILALQVPAVDSPNFRPARPPRLVSGTSTSMGGFPFSVQGVRFGGLKSVKFGLVPVGCWLLAQRPQRQRRTQNAANSSRQPPPPPGCGFRVVGYFLFFWTAHGPAGLMPHHASCGPMHRGPPLGLGPLGGLQNRLLLLLEPRTCFYQPLAPSPSRPCWACWA